MAAVRSRKEDVMAFNAQKLMKKVSEASAGLAVAVAFLNTALLIVKLVQTVSEEASELDYDTKELE